MAVKITTTRQAAASNGVKICVYGQAGAGKTVLCATTGKPDKTIILSAEAGLLSIRDADIPVIEIKTIDDLTEAYLWLTKTPEGQAFEWICLDSISEIAEVVLNAAKKATKDPRQAYGEMQEKVEDIIRAFRDIPRNVYFAAKMESYQDDNGVVRYQPLLPGKKLPQQLPYFFDEVFFLRVEKDAQGTTKRWLQTQPDVKYHAKDRSGALNAAEEPFLQTIAEKIQGKIEPNVTQ
ncbi:AAA family ATPase [Moraxella atlantae]|uniref:AAA family ATPase n=1 Tax=Faucicola atlantae TaxID=34059 RepID=A0A1B8Q907_9GAMM|nr:ATP-binding protein [Moraxella atlantae]OBX73768.1 AAA family ATPase [Moraxella atlantae]